MPYDETGTWYDDPVYVDPTTAPTWDPNDPRIPPGYVYGSDVGLDTYINQTYGGSAPPPTGAGEQETPATGLEAFFPGGQFNGDFQGYFNALFPGDTLTSADLRAKQAELQRAGITLHTSTSGDNIDVPGLGLIDVIQDAGGLNQKVWQVNTGGGSTAAPAPMTVDSSYLKPFELAFGDFDPAYVEPSRAELPPPFAFDQFRPPTAESILADPSYQFRQDQARGMVENSAAGRGLLNSGGTLYDLLNLGSNMASQEYGNIWNRDFNLWGAENQNKLNAFATNYGITGDAYGRIEDQYKDLRSTFYQNQNNPFQKLFQVAGLGANAAAG